MRTIIRLFIASVLVTLVSMSVAADIFDYGGIGNLYDLVGGGLLIIQAGGEATSPPTRGPAEWNLLTDFDRLVRSRIRRAGRMLTRGVLVAEP